uniref:Pre-B-cell leukemia transcription factor 4 n=1 Tax=Magallana gigas TaxID=29159 RepID=K1PG94_MAGGI|eukprot:XP_011420773.1 PREDICTED: pre-B-cell leukemia transcription factor 1 [Crassostrea gigas]
MASIVRNSKQQQSVIGCEGLAKLSTHPMFEDLQATLASDCLQASVPYALCSDQSLPNCDSQPTPEHSYAVVQETTLQQQFLELSSKSNSKVQELKTFYNTQLATIETQRLDAVAKLKAHPIDTPSHYLKEMTSIHAYHDKQRAHLTNRVYSSLQLLKISIDKLPDSSTSTRPRSRQLNSKATSIMSHWFEKNIDHPYPSDEQKEQLAREGGITVAQVKAWFANKRNRTSNTKPKKQKMQVEKKLLSICSELTGSSSKQPGVYGEIIQQLSDIVNASTVFNQGIERPEMDYLFSSEDSNGSA